MKIMKSSNLKFALPLAMTIVMGGIAHATTVATTPSGLVATQPAAAIGTAVGVPTSIPTTAIPKMPEMPAMPTMPGMPQVTPGSTAQPPVMSPSSAMSDHMHMMMAPPANATPATKAFVETNTKMHQGMAIQFSDNADVDFVKGMIPHHQGAVDMAKIVLQYGKDPEIKKFAESIIKAQSTEIDFMNAWLKKNAK